MSLPSDSSEPLDGGDLRQARDVLADLGALRRTRQHLALVVDDIGKAGLADLGIAEEILQEAQIDFGDRDLRIRMRQRDRGERPPVAEIGRRKAGAAGGGLGEAQVAGEIGVAAVVDGLAREAQLLAALGREQRQLAHIGHLGQQLRIVGAAVLDLVRRGPRHPVDLPFEVGHRLLDALGGRLGLLRHAVGQRGLDAAIADPDFHRAVDGQHEHDKADQRDDVFREQALTQEPDLILDGVHIRNPHAPRILCAHRFVGGSIPGREPPRLGHV